MPRRDVPASRRDTPTGTPTGGTPTTGTPTTGTPADCHTGRPDDGRHDGPHDGRHEGPRASSRTAPRRRPTFRRLVAQGWVPDQHGAWPMATVPIVVGGLASHLRWEHLLLLLAWVCGFLFFHVGGLWLASPRRARYVPALRTWTVGTAVLGGALLVLSPALSWWTPLFLPLVAVAVLEAARRRTRSMASRASTVLASTLTCAVAHDLGWGTVRGDGWWPWWDGAATVPGSGWGHAWIVTAVLGAYFLGTVPHVRALIRGRGNPAWAVGSVAWHVLGLVGVVTAATVGGVSWWVVAVWAVVLLRAVLIPLDQSRRGPWPPKAIGLTEMAVCLAVAVTLLLPA